MADRITFLGSGKIDEVVLILKCNAIMQPILMEFKTFKRVLVLFWTLYFSIVFASNVFNFLQEQLIISEHWKFSSDNFSLIKNYTSIYKVPGWLPYLLFLGVIVWEGFGVVLFWRSVWHMSFKSYKSDRVVQIPFFVTISLWMGFILSDEILLVYKAGSIQTAHTVLFIAELISLFFIRYDK